MVTRPPKNNSIFPKWMRSHLDLLALSKLHRQWQEKCQALPGRCHILFSQQSVATSPVFLTMSLFCLVVAPVLVVTFLPPKAQITGAMVATAGSFLLGRALCNLPILQRLFLPSRVLRNGVLRLAETEWSKGAFGSPAVPELLVVISLLERRVVILHSAGWIDSEKVGLWATHIRQAWSAFKLADGLESLLHSWVEAISEKSDPGLFEGSAPPPAGTDNDTIPGLSWTFLENGDIIGGVSSPPREKPV